MQQIFDARQSARRLLASVLLGAAASALAQPPESTPGRPNVPSHRKIQCESALPATQIAVKAEPARVELDYPSWKELGKHFKVGDDTRVMGRTTVHPKMETRVGGQALPATEGKIGCFRPNVRVTLSASPQKVSIAREVPRDSCGYQHVLRHEMEHVRINQAGIETLAAFLQSELSKRYGNQVYYGNLAVLQKALKQDVQAWLPLIQREFTSRLAAPHSQLDTPKEYARSRTVCNGELARLLDSSAGQ